MLKLSPARGDGVGGDWRGGEAQQNNFEVAHTREAQHTDRDNGILPRRHCRGNDEDEDAGSVRRC
jgi:hypothetical protein